MTDPQRTLRIFEAALELDAHERTAFLERECGIDPGLRAEVQALLDADAAAGSFLAQPLSTTTDRSGERLGAYRLLHVIGSGGMGTVYRGERADGAYARPVAIKLLLFDAGDLRARFAIEQRILGALSHPHIANLLDIGVDSNGAPYLVMEYVEGRTITAFAHDQAMDIRARVRLFLKILDAVQTAHAHLIVHRDIKPGNVLVDAHGEPKLLDFGIAKLLGDGAASTTRTGLGPLTPQYASPEQARGDPIGIGSDIYSLGVMLYELIAGERPYQVKDSRASAIERVICEVDPPRPSRHLDSRRIGGSARDLDAIVLKALEKIPRNRYSSCAAFADDLVRWLDGVDVLARRPGLVERAVRLARRHRLAISATAVASLALLCGSAIALWQAHVAREQAQIARAERDRAQRINRFLTDMLGAANPADLGRKATVMQVLDRARRLVATELANDPASASSAQLTLAQTYRALGDLDVAQAVGTDALQSARRTNDTATIIDAESTLGNVYFDKGNFREAQRLYRQAHADAAAHGNELQKGTTAFDLGISENERGNAEKAQAWLRLALAELPQDAALERALALDSSGFSRNLLGDKQGAISLRRQAIAVMQHAFPHGHPMLATISGNLAVALERAGRYDEAVTILNRILPQQIETLGENHADVVWTLSTLASIEYKRNRVAAALDYGKRAYDIAGHYSDDNDWKAYAYEKYGDYLIGADRAAEALPILRSALKIDKAVLPADHESIASVESAMALAQCKLGDCKQGEALARSAYQRLLVKYGAENAFAMAAKSRLDQIEALSGK
ncbi:MAG: tetratricopeptide repeat protein [Rudaea sp.]